MTKASGAAGKLRRCLTAPGRVLRRARDIYVNVLLVGCAGKGRSAPVFAALPRGRSHAFHNQSRGADAGEAGDIDELIRAASTRQLRAVPIKSKSQGVVAMRIDEDRPCDFGGDFGVVSGGVAYPRSRSCAVVTNTRVR